MNKAPLIALAMGFAALATGCHKTATDEIPIGEFASLSGGTASFGQSSHHGTQMAIDEVNAAGGVLGKKLVLHTEDDQSKGGEAGTVARKLISQEKVVALLGEVASSRSLEAAPIAQKAKIPMISPASTNPKVTETGDYIFRVCFIDPFQGSVMAKFAFSRGWKKVAVLTDVKQDYAVGLAQFFKEYVTKNGGTLLLEQSYSSGDKDFRAQLTSLKAQNPEAILVAGYYGEAGLIANQARQLGLDCPLLGGDGWDGKALVEVGGKAIEGNFFSNHFSAENQAPNIQAFLKRYEEKFHEKADAMAALGYDSAMILADAIKRAGTTEGDKLRDAIAATKDFEGVTGKITINAQRNADKPAVILTIADGKYKYVETVSP